MIDKLIERYIYISKHSANTQNSNIRSLLDCGIDQTKIYDKIKGKKIDDSRLQLVPASYVPPEGSINWYRAGASATDNVLAFADHRDPTYNYLIAIFIHGWPLNPDCCKSNPIIDCVCGTTSFCILTAVQDKSGTIVDTTIPDKVINDAISLLYPSNLGLYVGIGFGLIALYLITKKK